MRAKSFALRRKRLDIHTYFTIHRVNCKIQTVVCKLHSVNFTPHRVGSCLYLDDDLFCAGKVCVCTQSSESF